MFDKRAQEAWGQDVVVVPMAFFAMPCDGDITLSSEHTEIVWLPYEEAERRVMFHDQKNALYELCEPAPPGQSDPAIASSSALSQTPAG